MFISAFLPLFLHRMDDEVHTPRERLRRSLGDCRLTAARKEAGTNRWFVPENARGVLLLK